MRIYILNPAALISRQSYWPKFKFFYRHPRHVVKIICIRLLITMLRSSKLSVVI